MFTPGTASPGFYVGGEGGLNWLLNNNGYTMDTGYAVGGKIGYDFVGPGVELERLYRNNRGSGIVRSPNGSFNYVTGQVNQISAMANVLYDFALCATIAARPIGPNCRSRASVASRRPGSRPTLGTGIPSPAKATTVAVATRARATSRSTAARKARRPFRAEATSGPSSAG